MFQGRIIEQYFGQPPQGPRDLGASEAKIEGPQINLMTFFLVLSFIFSVKNGILCQYLGPPKIFRPRAP